MSITYIIRSALYSRLTYKKTWNSVSVATDECCGKILSLALSKDERAKYENEAFSWI